MDVLADIVLISDFKFPGGTANAMLAEIEALSAAGYRVALKAYASAFLARTRSHHPEITQAIEAGQAVLVPPGTRVRARLACLHHPAVFEHPPAEDMQIDADQAVMVVHHPPLNPMQEPQYDVGAVQRVLSLVIGKPVDWAPVGPKVREAFARLQSPPPLTEDDWVNVIDAEKYAGARFGLWGGLPVVGRHSRPDLLKWPDTKDALLAAYPDAPDIRVRLMGFDAKSYPELWKVPDLWSISPFGAQPVPEFLRSLDFFSYFHSDAWTEAFGRSVLEAMASGLVCILPQDFEPLFGDGAIYCGPHQVGQTVRMFASDPELFARQSVNAVRFVSDRYGLDRAVARVANRIGPPDKKIAPFFLPKQGQKPRILYFTSNGVGMGHITRVLACARRQPDRIDPIIVSMSRAFTIARAEGFTTEFLPFARSIDMPLEQWNEYLRAELVMLLRHYKPRVLVLDGNVPYPGLLQALDACPDIWTIWMRRAMWPPNVGAHFLKHENAFDAVIEPGELAGAFDRGLTVERRGSAKLVAPMRYLKEGEALERGAARALLGLDPKRPAVFLQLGSGNNIETVELMQQIVRKLTEDPPGEAPQIVIGQWQIGKTQLPPPDGAIVLQKFPFARYLAAFDYAVAMAGYNTFHENLSAGLPTLFLANEHPEQDEQWLRADYARIKGCALAARLENRYDILRQLYLLAAPACQADLRRACKGLFTNNGADEAASYLADLAYAIRPHSTKAAL